MRKQQGKRTNGNSLQSILKWVRERENGWMNFNLRPKAMHTHTHTSYVRCTKGGNQIQLKSSHLKQTIITLFSFFIPILSIHFSDGMKEFEISLFIRIHRRVSKITQFCDLAMRQNVCVCVTSFWIVTEYYYCRFINCVEKPFLSARLIVWTNE